WWRQAGGFVKFLGRCTFLLQRGHFVADVLYYNGDDVPNFVPPKRLDPSLGSGYDYDVCNTEILLERLSVANGRIVLPDGMSYRVLVLPERQAMPLAALRKVRELVVGGATIVGPKPLRTLGLKDYPQCDAALRQLADDLWGRDSAANGAVVVDRRHGKGRVIWGAKL